MITNPQQYKLTLQHIKKFEEELERIARTTPESLNIDPRWLKVGRESIESQLEDLYGEIDEYETLTSAKSHIIEIDNIDDLPIGLIKARLTSGLAQAKLAERLGMDTDELIRKEVNEYSGVDFENLREIAEALNLRINQDIRVPFQAKNFNEVAYKIQQAGLSRKFLLDRLVINSKENICNLAVERQNNIDSLNEDFYKCMDRIFGWTIEMLTSEAPLPSPTIAGARARFKMPVAREYRNTSTYVAYAHYLGLVVLAASKDLPVKKIPSDPALVRRIIKNEYREITLSSCLNFAWDSGVAVLPLNDSGAFHGACWRYNGRNVIVLKQKSQLCSLWLFDLLHELFHASQYPELETFSVIEADETAVERRESDEEISANQFAENIIFDGQANELAKKCVAKANKNIAMLSIAVSKVANEEGVDAGMLANYLAHRLSRKGINWWGSAQNLQNKKQNAWEIAKKIFLKRFPLKQSDDIDQILVNNAING